MEGIGLMIRSLRGGILMNEMGGLWVFRDRVYWRLWDVLEVKGR